LSKAKYKLGLIGYPVEHSYSAIIHEAFLSNLRLNGEYHLYPIPELPVGELELLKLLEKLRQGEILGLNVTIPHKETVLKYVDCLTETARSINAVNTIICEQGMLIGENTDATGFYIDLVNKTRNILNNNALQNPTPKSEGSAIILGAGGGARSVAYSLLKSNWKVILAARRVSQAEVVAMDLKKIFLNAYVTAISLNEAELDFFSKKAELIINCTPVGMYPDIDSCPWPENINLPDQCFVYDLIYNPKITRLLQLAASQRVFNSGGIGMLIEQAALSFKYWLGIDPPRDLMAKTLGSLI